MKKTLLFVIFISFLTGHVHGQTSCGSPLALSVGSTQCGTNSNVGSFPDDGSAPTNLCNSLYNDGEYWFSFTGTGLPLSLAVTGLTATYSGLYVLSACPGAGACVASYSSGSSTANFNVTTPALTLGQVYYIVIANWAAPYSTNFCLTSSIATPPSNDDPCSATPITAGASCVYSTYTNANATATAGVPAPGCASYSGGDVWFSVTVPASGSVTFDSNTGVILDAGMAIYSGTCGSLSLIECDDDDSPNGAMSMIALTGQTPGATLWVRMWEFGNNNNGTFQLCATDPGGGGGGPANDNPCAATALTVNASCVTVGSTNASASATGGVPAPGCAGYAGGDVWFTAVVPPSGFISVETTAGVMTDGGLAIYTGTCGSLSLNECNDDDGTGAMSLIDDVSLTPGSTVWIRVWEYSNDNNGTFNICAYEGTPTICGNSTNDFCEDPAILTQGAGTWSSSTSSIYTADEPGNTGVVFCGSIENNSWYQFTATSTTETFNFTSVANCTWGDGVQAEVYSVSTDVNGCCTAVSSMSNCWNPGFATTGSVTATGLTIGNTYYLMVDGYAGDDCDFTVSGWTATGILPVSLTNLYGVSNQFENTLHWTTKSELNNDYFIVEKSLDGINYEKVGIVQGAGNSSANIEYTFGDSYYRASLVYYRLIQVDFDGTKETIGNLSITRDLESVQVYPNPANNELFVAFENLIPQGIKIQFTDVSGKIVEENGLTENGTFSSSVFGSLDSGLYIVRIIDLSGNVISIQKVMKID